MDSIDHSAENSAEEASWEEVPKQDMQSEAESLAEASVEAKENSSQEESNSGENADANIEVIDAEDTTETAEVAEEIEGITAWSPEPEKLLQALLFATHEYLSAKALKDILGDDWVVPRIRQLVKSVNHKWEAQEAPFEIVEVDGAFRCRTRTQYYPWVRKLFKESAPRRLSQASLETLAIVAYKQPITKAEMESIRGVNVDGCIKSLLDKKLIDITGKADALGGSFNYATTKEFLRYFGISKVPDDLPRLSEFEEILQAQSLIPQIRADGSVVHMEQADAEQMTLDMQTARNAQPVRDFQNANPQED